MSNKVYCKLTGTYFLVKLLILNNGTITVHALENPNISPLFQILYPTLSFSYQQLDSSCQLLQINNCIFISLDVRQILFAASINSNIWFSGHRSHRIPHQNAPLSRHEVLSDNAMTFDLLVNFLTSSFPILQLFQAFPAQSDRTKMNSILQKK